MPRNDRGAMNAYSSDFHQPSGEAVNRAPVLAAQMTASMSMRWAALHDAAGAVAALAKCPLESASHGSQEFSAMIADAPCWKAKMLSNGLEDIAAVMQAGLTALLTVNAEGRDPAAAALALWNEFEHSCDALLELASDR